MKYVKVIVFSFGMGFLCYFTPAKGCLSQSQISKQAALIETKIKRERFVVYGLTALGIMHELYQWTPYINSLLGYIPTEKHTKEDASLLQAVKNGFISLFYTPQGWNSIFQTGLSICGAVMISEVAKKFTHPNTLYWYINTHAPYKRTIALMKEQVNDSVMHKQLLLNLYDCLVQQSIKMCAYMTYKSKNLDDNTKVVAQKAVQCMIEIQNDWLQRIGALLHADVIDSEEIENLLTEYEKDIDSHINHFSVIESESAYERAIIKRQIRLAETD